MTESVDKSYWTCRWQNIGAHDTLLGYCTRVAKNNPDGKKAIPGEHVDKGCKFWEEKPPRAFNRQDDGALKKGDGNDSL